LHKAIRERRGSIILEFSICGIIFIGITFGMIVMGIWMYNVSQVKQASRIAAHNIAVTGNPTEARDKAMKYLDKTLLACPNKEIEVYGDHEKGYGAVEAEMNPLFPGLIRPAVRSQWPRQGRPFCKPRTFPG